MTDEDKRPVVVVRLDRTALDVAAADGIRVEVKTVEV